MRTFFLMLGLIVYPLAVHGLVLLGAPWIAVIGLVVTSLVSLLALVFVQGANRRYSWLALYVLLAALGVVNAMTDSIYALFLPPVIINLGLMLFFGATLQPGETPLIERLMRLEHTRRPAPELQRFARRLTWIWTLYFGVVAAVSLLLAWRAPLEVWSLFTNVLNFVFVGTLFAAQFLYRWAHFGRAGMLPPWRLIGRLVRLPLSDATHPFYGGPRK